MIGFLMSLPTSLPSALEDHPWVRSTLGKSEGELDDCLGALGGKDWPVVVQHGDFVPWNLLRRPDGSLGAIDWEFGTLRGFPHLDLAYYTLQVAALIYRWTPSKAAEYTTRYLTSHARFDLESAEARALTRIAAYGVYQRFREEGKPSHQIPRTWWRAVWEERP
jgi:aminoglycoside phosphotransferase (APT) family kinase protein